MLLKKVYKKQNKKGSLGSSFYSYSYYPEVYTVIFFPDDCKTDNT